VCRDSSEVVQVQKDFIEMCEKEQEERLKAKENGDDDDLLVENPNHKNRLRVFSFKDDDGDDDSEEGEEDDDEEEDEEEEEESEENEDQSGKLSKKLQAINLQ
jgi:hypothetical protein